MTEKRPSLNRKHTATSEAARKSALDAGVRFTLGDETYEIRMGDVTPLAARTFRREYGQTFMSVLSDLEAAPDLDSVAALIWLARTIRGEDVSFEDIALSYADIQGLSMDDPDAQEDDGDPEA